MAATSKSSIELAIITENVTGMRGDIQALRADITAVLADHESRIRIIESINQRQAHTSEQLADHEERLRHVESDNAEMKVNQRNTTGILAGLQIITGAIAAFIGSLK